MANVEETIKALEICSQTGWCKGQNGCPYWQDDLDGMDQIDNCKRMLSDALKLIEDLQERIAIMEEGWHSVKDKLPKDGQKVLLYYPPMEMTVDVFRAGEVPGFEDTGFLWDNMMWHWIPEEPKEGEQE